MTFQFRKMNKFWSSAVQHCACRKQYDTLKNLLKAYLMWNVLTTVTFLKRKEKKKYISLSFGEKPEWKSIFFFLGPHPWHMEVPTPGVESELQLQACVTATAMADLTHICNLCHSMWHCQILNLHPHRDNVGSLTC